jgi:hypothetical protein
VHSPDGTLPRFVVVRLKNRYLEPLFNGYRDGLYNIALALDAGVWMICEVQLHLGALLVYKRESHAYYEFFRSYFHGSSAAIETRMRALEQIGIAPSPDVLMREALQGSDEDVLAGLAQLFLILGDHPLLVEVQERRLALATCAGQTLPEVAALHDALAWALRSSGRYTEAEPLMRKALATECKVLGKSHPDTLMTMMNLANLLKHI